MTHQARTTLTSSLLAATVALALTAALAACAGGSGTGQGTTTADVSAPADRGASAASGGGGLPGGPAGSSSAGPAASGGRGTVPAAAWQLLCPPPGPGFGGLSLLRTAGQPVPARFRAAAVVECVPAGGIAPAGAQSAYVRKEAAVGNLSPLLAALRRPSARRAATGLPARCRVPALVVPLLALIGRDGAVVYPRVPVTVCGAPIQPVVASLAALHWIMLSTAVGTGSGVRPSAP